MERGKANESRAKVVDFGQKQFAKLAEAYGTDAGELIATGETRFLDRNGKPSLVAKLNTREGDYDTILVNELKFVS